MKIKDIIATIPEEKQKEIEKTMEACTKSICCEKVNWKEFNVYDSSNKLMSKILQNLSVEFLLPIAERVRDEERELTILCNMWTENKDEIWFVNVDAAKMYATISLSPQTTKMLSKNQE